LNVQNVIIAPHFSDDNVDTSAPGSDASGLYTRYIM